MKTHDSWYHLGAVLILFLGLGAWTGAAPVADAATEEAPLPVREWVWVVLMPYDNDLALCGNIVRREIGRGVKDSEIAVALLADDPLPNGVTRQVITRAGTTATRLPTEDGATLETITAFLDWVAITLPAKNYAIFFLGHGGLADELALDEWPGEGREPAWLPADAAGMARRRFREQVVPGEVKLLFLQQCGRASLDCLYAFRGTAHAVLASPVEIGAPNCYYQPTLTWLAAHPAATGAELARVITETDRHFITYVTVDGAALEELPDRLEPLLKAWRGDGALFQSPRGLKPCLTVPGESCYDLQAWLVAACAANQSRGEAERRQFQTWVDHQLRLSLRHHPDFPSPGGCGLTWAVPEVAPASRSWYQALPLLPH